MGICRLFDPYPKSKREDFFDNEELINEVEKLLEGKFWPLILGPKRTGKTSVLKIVANELGGVYIDASGIKTLRELGDSLVNSLQTRVQVDLKVVKVEIYKRPVRGLKELLGKLGDSVILIDEVQNLASPWFASLLSTAYNTSGVRFAFTGSMIGLAKTLAGQGTGKKVGKSFKGRPIVEVEASPFDEVKSREFLRTGADLCNVSMQDSEIEDAAEAYRGIQGWLTYYGNFRALGYSHDRAKEMVFRTAKGIILEELKALSELQRTIMRALSLVEGAGWSDLKALTESLMRRELQDWTFDHALKQLVNARLVRKEGNKYSVIDPMYKAVMSS